MYVKIDFKSAGLNVVEPPKKNGEIKLDDNGEVAFSKITGNFDLTGNNFLGYSPRKNHEILSTYGGDNPFGTVLKPIHLEQVSNMLHVLLGERPVSTFHTPKLNGKPIRSRISNIDDIVKTGFYKLNNTYTYEDKNGDKRAYYEFKSGKKMSSSNPKNSINISFRTLKNYFIVNESVDRYHKFIEILSKYTNKPVNEENYSSVSNAYYDLFSDEDGKKIDYPTAFTRYKNEEGSKFHSLIKELDENGFDLKFINGTFRNPSPKNVMSMKCTNVQIMRTISLDGSFIFKVDSETAKRLLNGKKCASFLDNGVVTISDWKEEFGVNSPIIDEVEESDIIGMGYSKIV